MNIEQIAIGIKDANGLDMSDEAAVTLLRRALSKLAEQDVEPVAHAVLEGRDTADSGWGYIAAWPEACHEHINEAIVEYEVEGAGDWKVVPLYTETQYLAAQQRTAEACAKAVFEQAKYFGYNVHAEAVRDAALNNWREYL